MHVPPYIASLFFLLYCVNHVSLKAEEERTCQCCMPHPGPRDCADVKKAGNTKCGIYRIWPLGWECYNSIVVYCDMVTDGGGWTVIQRRKTCDKPVDYFYKTWKEYQMGFGELENSFWLGNDYICALTNQGNYSLRINLKKKDGESRYALYKNFWIESERQLYKLHVSSYSGTAEHWPKYTQCPIVKVKNWGASYGDRIELHDWTGDSFTNHNGMKFSTKDSDNDIWDSSCAKGYYGGWWYGKCHQSNLNGLDLNGEHTSFGDGIEWHSWTGFHYSLAETVMMVRPR